MVFGYQTLNSRESTSARPCGYDRHMPSKEERSLPHALSSASQRLRGDLLVVVIMTTIWTTACNGCGARSSARALAPAPSERVAQPANAPANHAKNGSVQGGPSWTLRCQASSDCQSGTIFINRDSTDVISSVWVEARLRPGKVTSSLRVDVMKLPIPFYAATRLVDSETRNDSLYLLLEAVAVFGQPAGLRSVVRINPSVMVADDGTAEVATPAIQPSLGEGTDWRKTIDVDSMDPSSFAPLGQQVAELQKWTDERGLSIEALWQSAFRQRLERQTV